MIDKFGTELEIGMYVVGPKATGQSYTLGIGKITKITDKAVTCKVAYKYFGDRNRDIETSPNYRVRPDRTDILMVIPEPPEEWKEKLDA